MLGTRYTVRRGDTLWGLAERHLGGARRWPEVHRHNNRPAIANLTGTRIVDPNLIFVGQVLYLPEDTEHAPRRRTGPTRPGHRPTRAGPGRPPARSGATAAKSGKLDRQSASAGGRARTEVRGILFEYKLEDLPAIVVQAGMWRATVKLSGSVVLQPLKPVSFAQLTSTGFELESKAQADTALGKLVGGAKVDFNPATGEVKFGIGLTFNSDQPYSPTSSAGVTISKGGLPAVVYKIEAPPLQGRVDGYFYLAQKLAIEIEVTVAGAEQRLKLDSRRTVTEAQPEWPPPDPQHSWQELVAIGLVAGGVALIVGTIVEDVLTAGVGVADDVPSFALAAQMITRGTMLLRAVPAAVPVRVAVGAAAL